MTTERIDVLAVMDGFANRASYDFPALTVAELREARAAVAELIEAAKLLNCELPSPADAEVDYASAIDRFAAALARVGGAP